MSANSWSGKVLVGSNIISKVYHNVLKFLVGKRPSGQQYNIIGESQCVETLGRETSFWAII